MSTDKQMIDFIQKHGASAQQFFTRKGEEVWRIVLWNEEMQESQRSEGGSLREAINNAMKKAQQ